MIYTLEYLPIFVASQPIIATLMSLITPPKVPYSKVANHFSNLVL